MSDSVFYSQPSYILHYQNYRESSLIIDVLTRDFGRISLLAKGVRKAKSKTCGLLQPFKPLSLSYMGRSGLKTLTDAELLDVSGELSGINLYCGFYINELICNFLHKDDPHPEVFSDYQSCITQLSRYEFPESALRVFEMNLMENIGYGMHFGYDLKNNKPVELTKKYLFNKDHGFVEDADGRFSGATLLAIEQRVFVDPTVLSEAKKLMRMLIDSHLQGKRLKSRSVINKIAKRL
ncbi:MAG: DNA repair protein RecO [Methylococcaceae bacterium]|nr:DNA repair protein RecO [Methylococcaceae bacterium]